MEYIEKEVYFDKYCNKCKYETYEEKEYPCNECLTYCVNAYSHKPIKFEEAEENYKNEKNNKRKSANEFL